MPFLLYGLLTSFDDSDDDAELPTVCAASQPSLLQRVEEWTGAATKEWTGTVTKWNGRPLNDTGKIPNRLFVTWKTTTLPPRAKKLLRVWRRKEPQLAQVILTDKDCAWLAEHYPDLKPRYDALSMNVMRADICRVLAIYYFGGLYKDLDVAWVQPLSNWLDRNQHVVYGHEDDEHLCQWFFAARPGDPCIRNVLQHITNIIDNVTVDFNKNVEAVIDITGPGAFTDAMRGCPTPPRFSVNDMKFTMIHHEYAAQRWQTDQYASWLQDRKTHAGWQGIWPSDIRLNYYVLQPSSNFLAPLAQHLPALGVRAVATSSAFANNPYFFGAHLAVDGSLDTAFHTIEGTAAQWFDLELDAPLTIGTIATEDASRLTGIRLYNAKRLGNAMSAFNDGFFIELYDAENKLVFRSAKRFGTLAFQVIPFGGMPAHVRRIRVTKPDKLLTFSEIQLFSDPGLKAARRLVLLSEQTTAPELPPLLRLGSTVNASSAGAACPDSVAVALESRYLFSLCRAPKPPCSAVVLSNSTTPAPVDREFIDAMSRAGCAFLAFTRVAPAVPVMHTEATWCTPTETGVRCDNAKQIVETLAATKAQERIMLVDASESDWLSPDSIVEYALQVRPQTLLLVLHFTSETSTSAVALAHAAKLSSQYDLVAWHIQHSGGFHAMPRANDTLVHVPKELHTTWHLRA